VETEHNNQNPSEPVHTGADGFAQWLTVKEAVTYCHEQGLSRTAKTVRKWAQLAHHTGGEGDVNVRHQDTGNGFRWLIECDSLEVKIAQEKEYEAREAEHSSNDFDAEQVHTGAHRLLPVHTGAHTEASDDSEPTTSEQVRTDAHLSEPPARADEMVEFLKAQIGEKDRQLRTKDDQIAAMLERDRETNVLIRGLQDMIGLPAPRVRNDGRVEGDNRGQHDA
jgi:transposase